MTTYVIDNCSAACDSMWSDAKGHECDVPINKYLYISKDSDSSGLDVEPSITLYSGDYEHTEKLHMALQSGERTVDMSKLKYAGCTTSSRVEADVFSPKDVVKKEKIRISKIRNSKSFSSPQLSGHKRKKLSPDAFLDSHHK